MILGEELPIRAILTARIVKDDSSCHYRYIIDVAGNQLTLGTISYETVEDHPDAMRHWSRNITAELIRRTGGPDINDSLLRK